MTTFQLFFQSREQVVVRQAQIRRIGWVIKTLEAEVGKFLLGCKCPESRCIVVQEQDPLGELPVAFFLQNVLQLHQQRWVILRVDSLALWKIIKQEDTIPSLSKKKSRWELFQRIFALGIFWGGVSRYAATPLIVALSPGHKDITRFRPCHQSREEIIWIAPKKFQICSDDWHRWRFWSAFRHFRTHFAESFRMSKSSWMTDTTRSREIPSCSAIHLD